MIPSRPTLFNPNHTAAVLHKAMRYYQASIASGKNAHPKGSRRHSLLERAWGTVGSRYLTVHPQTDECGLAP